MKKLTQWFNNQPAAKQRRLLLGFSLLFASLLMASIAWQRLELNFGTVKQPFIKTDTQKKQ
jgi:hypothetical protein